MIKKGDLKDSLLEVIYKTKQDIDLPMYTSILKCLRIHPGYKHV